ncbi:MAG: HlyD family efflux transporter periplasmic adaptor subunit [Mariprofundaceae bacterium]
MLLMRSPGISLKRYIVAAAITVLLFFTLFYIDLIKPADTVALQYITVQKQNFDITVHTIGELDTVRSYMVTSEIQGNKGKIVFLAKDGSSVNKGEVLVRFDPTPFEEEIVKLQGEVGSLTPILKATEQIYEINKNDAERSILDAEFDVKSQAIDLRKILKGDGPVRISEHENDVEEAEQTYLEQENFVKELIKLNDQGFTYATEIAQAKKKMISLEKIYQITKRKRDTYKKYLLPSMLKKAEMSERNAVMKLDKVGEGSVYVVAKSRANLEKALHDRSSAENNLKRALMELGKTTMRAPFDGIVVLVENYYSGERRKPRIGDGVIQNSPILSLPDISAYIVYTKVREIDLHKVEIGQKATVLVDAFPELFLHGTVTSIGALALKSNGFSNEKYFHINITLDENDLRLRPGMTVRASVVSRKIDDVLTIPVMALFGEQGAFFVYRYNNVAFEKVDVIIGFQNYDVAEIRSGLNLGDRVSLIDPGAAP